MLLALAHNEAPARGACVNDVQRDGAPTYYHFPSLQTHTHTRSHSLTHAHTHSHPHSHTPIAHSPVSMCSPTNPYLLHPLLLRFAPLHTAHHLSLFRSPSFDLHRFPQVSRRQLQRGSGEGDGEKDGAGALPPPIFSHTHTHTHSHTGVHVFPITTSRASLTQSPSFTISLFRSPPFATPRTAPLQC